MEDLDYDTGAISIKVTGITLYLHDIQFTPASLFHFVVIFFDFVQNSIEPRPVMSPTPNLESFQPPK